MIGDTLTAPDPLQYVTTLWLLCSKLLALYSTGSSVAVWSLLWCQPTAPSQHTELAMNDRPARCLGPLPERLRGLELV